ncbi:response regulator [Nitriliruptoraceae bacterium ZYF776]|nr:response regulator [Profundirhabdus halotolerans]
MAVPRRARPRRRPRRDQLMASEQRARVVIVDDEPGVRQILGMTLDRSERFEVVAQAEDGRDALSAIETHQPDVVLLDLMLGPEWGTDLILPALAVSPNSMIAVMTALSAEREEAAALLAGAFVFYEKTMVTSLVEFLERDLSLFARALAGEDVLAPSAVQRRTSAVSRERP